jgi:hypothetical protein
MLRIIVIGSCLLALGQTAIAEPKYGARTKTLPSIEIRSDEPEVDAFLNMTCVAPLTLDVRIGGEIPKGKGELDPDSLTLSDGTLTTKIIGASVKSPDIEMTGGTMGADLAAGERPCHKHSHLRQADRDQARHRRVVESVARQACDRCAEGIHCQMLLTTNAEIFI